MINENTLVDQKVINYLYEIDSYYDLIEFKEIEENTHKEYLGNKDIRKCRFCGRDNSQVTFNKIAHAVPELLGNKTLLSYYECDECNQKFADKLENELSSYLSFYRSLVRMKGKKGPIKFKRHNIRMYNENGMFHINTIGQTQNVIINEEDKTFTIKLSRDTYIPIAVYKCFVKIALTLLEEKYLEKLEWAIQWINEEDHSNSSINISPLYLYEVFTPGNCPYHGISIFIFKRKEKFEYKVYKDTVSYMIFVIRFQNFVFQIDIPSKDDFNQPPTTKKIIRFPGVGDNYMYGKSQYTCKDMNGREKVKNDVLEISMRYDSSKDVTENINL